MKNSIRTPLGRILKMAEEKTMIKINILSKLKIVTISLGLFGAFLAPECSDVDATTAAYINQQVSIIVKAMVAQMPPVYAQLVDAQLVSIESSISQATMNGGNGGYPFSSATAGGKADINLFIQQTAEDVLLAATSK